MLNNKLTKTLSSLDSSNIGRLNNFMQSAYFVNQNSPLVCLYRLIMEYYPHFEDISQKSIFIKIFPELPFKAKKIRDLCSDLTLLIEEFLVIEFLKQRKSRFYQLKSLHYYEIGHFIDFHKSAKRALKEWRSEKDIYSSFEKLSLYQHIHYYPYSEKQNQSNTFLNNANQLTDEVYVLSKLRYYCEAQTGKFIYRQEFSPTFSEEVFKMAEIIRPKFPLIDLYLRLINLHQNLKTDTYFLETREQFYQLYPSINPFEASIILTLLLNFCGFQYYLKKEIYLNYQFQLHKFGLVNQLFSLYGYLNHTTFMNIIITASGMKDYAFIDKFLKINSQKLNVQYRNKCKQLGQSYKHFAQGEYAQANQKVIFLEDKTIFFSLRARFIALRCNFEFLIKDENQKGPFLAHCQNFKKFINSQEQSLANSRRTTYLNHVTILEDIAKILVEGQLSNAEGQQFLNKINLRGSLVGWQYLQEKIYQLIQEN